MDICRGRGESVLNYVIVDEKVWGRVERVRVEDRTESDHFPLVVWIRGEGKVSRRAGEGEGDGDGRKKVRGNLGRE